MGDYLDQMATTEDEEITVDTETTRLPESDANVKSLPPSQTLP